MSESISLSLSLSLSALEREHMSAGDTCGGQKATSRVGSHLPFGQGRVSCCFCYTAYSRPASHKRQGDYPVLERF